MKNILESTRFCSLALLSNQGTDKPAQTLQSLGCSHTQSMYSDHYTGFPQAPEIIENLETHPKKFHAWKTHGI